MTQHLTLIFTLVALLFAAIGLYKAFEQPYSLQIEIEVQYGKQ